MNAGDDNHPTDPALIPLLNLCANDMSKLQLVLNLTEFGIGLAHYLLCLSIIDCAF